MDNLFRILVAAVVLVLIISGIGGISKLDKCRKDIARCDEDEGEGGGIATDYARVIYADLEVRGLLNPDTAALKAEAERLRRTVAQAALCILENPYQVITDTLWLSENRNGGTTLFESLVDELDIEIEGTHEDHIAALKKYLHENALKKALATTTQEKIS